MSPPGAAAAGGTPAVARPPNSTSPPGCKRLLVVGSVIAYVVFLGVPVWWHTTKLHRPELPHEDMQQAARDAASKADFLPVTLQLVLVQPAGSQHASPQEQHDLAAALYNSIKTSTTSSSSGGMPAQLLPVVVATAGGSPHCTVYPGAGNDARTAVDCPDLARLYGSAEAGTSGPSQQQQQQLDELLLQSLSRRQQQQQLSVLAAAGQPGQYTLLLLPEGLHGEHLAGAASAKRRDAGGARLVVGRHRHAWLTYDSTSSTPQQLQEMAVAAVAAALSCCFGLHAGAAGLPAAASLPVSAGGRTHLSLSLLNAAPEAGRHYSWDMQHWEEVFLVTVAASLASVTTISLESQVLHFTPARSPGHWSAAHAAYVVQDSQLPFFIDSEWALEAGRAVSPQRAAGNMHLSTLHAHGGSGVNAAAGGDSSSGSSAGAGAAGRTVDRSSSSSAALLDEPHVLQFVVYIPPQDHSPLLLLASGRQPQHGNSYVIPSWGGLLVLNPDQRDEQQQALEGQDRDESESEGSSRSGDMKDCGAPWTPQELSTAQYQHVTNVIIAQLQALFGVAGLHSQQQQQVAVEVQWLPAGSAGFSSWQVDALLRQRAVHGVQEAARVLAALSTLVQELPNLEMPDLIGQQVAAALSDLQLARSHTAGGNYTSAAAAATAAHAAAEAAFSHPAVLTQLNFPDSHKLGVYMPLFLPLAVPLLQGLVLQLSHYKQRWRQWRQQAGAVRG